METELSVGFLGTGKMALALARGWIAAGSVPPERITGTDPLEAARRAFEEQTGASTREGPREVLTRTNVIVIAVKPGRVEEVLSQIAPFASPDHLFLSIAAGIPLRLLEENLVEGAPVVRIMPNTPALVGASATAFSLGMHAGRREADITRNLFSAVGLALELPESLLDAVTGLSGSGPAFVFQIIEALSDGGVACGLPRDTAQQLAAQTILGSARMVLETGEHPARLKDMVASPGGTTIEGIHELERGGLRATLMNAVRAATARSRKLGRGHGGGKRRILSPRGYRS